MHFFRETHSLAAPRAAARRELSRRSVEQLKEPLRQLLYCSPPLLSRAAGWRVLVLDELILHGAYAGRALQLRNMNTPPRRRGVWCRLAALARSELVEPFHREPVEPAHSEP